MSTTGPTSRRSAAATASHRSGGPADPRTLPQGAGDPAQPVASRSRSRDHRTLAADAASATRRDRQPPRDGRARDADGALPRAPAPAPLEPRPRDVRAEEGALLIEQQPAILMAMPDDELAMRDRALLLLGYAGAFRRSELVALDVERLRFSRTGCYAWISSAKNDPRKGARALRPRAASDVNQLGALRRRGARALACDRRPNGAGISNVRSKPKTHDNTPRLRRRSARSSTSVIGRGRLRRLRRSLVTPRLHYRRGKEEGAHRKHQAGNWAAI